MPPNSRIAWISAGTGLILWLIALLVLSFSPIQQLFLLAPLVLVPLGLPLLTPIDRQGRSQSYFRFLSTFQPLAAWLLFASFTQPPGPLAAGLASAWALMTFLCGLGGLLRLLPHGLSDIGELCLDAALLFLPVGGIWLLASRLGVGLMGFQEPIVLLTAVHFHFAGFAACLLTGLSGRLDLPRSVYRPVVIGVMAGIPLLALGISFAPLLEVFSAFVFASSLATLAVLWLMQLPRLRRGRVLLAVSGLSVLVSMAYALTFSIAEFLGLIWVTIPQMAQGHGALNALGFALLGLLAFWRLRPQPRITPPGMPFSQLASQGFVGPDFFSRIKAIPKQVSAVPTGLLDNLESFRRPGLEPLQIDPRIRHFYEHTADYALYVTPYWQPGFRLGGKIWRALAERIGQMCLPVQGERRTDSIDSRILPVDESVDGRPGVRAWVRTYSDTGRACYVAAYAQHQWQNQVYMNIAFALPGGHMTSILRLDGLPVSGHSHQALRLTTLFPEHETGDQGVYLISYQQPVRLPLNETITVWCADMPGFEKLTADPDMQTAPLLALHDMWIFGIRFLRLHYFIFPLEVSVSG